MLKALKNLAAAKEPSGALSGKQIILNRVVKVDRLLGEGGFATIYRCSDIETGEVFALKHFLLTGYPEAARDVDTEVAVMELLQGCPYIVRLHDATIAGPPTAPTAAFVLMDYCPDTLVAFLQRCSYNLDYETVLRIIVPICHGVAAMHSLQPPMAHRDLKAENVLLGPHGGWVLCDFGSATTRQGVLESARDIALEEEVVRRYTTPAYRAPELYDLYSREYIGPAVDIWSLGVLLYLLAYGKLPFEGEAKLQVLNGRYALPEGRPPPLRALIRDMLTVSPRERPTIQQVISRLEGMARAGDTLIPSGPQQQQLHPQIQGEGRQAPAAKHSSSGSGVSQQHERVPAQGWADFTAQSSPTPAAALRLASNSPAEFEHRRSGSTSWATFSPKQAAAAVAPEGAPAASAGSFWSSFGEEAPLVPPGPEERFPSAGTPQVEPDQQQGSNSAAVASARTSAAVATASSGGTAFDLPVETSPLSAGLAHMSLRQSPLPGRKSAANPCAPAATPSGPTGNCESTRTAQQGLAGEMEALRQHCLVLERLLERRSEEVHRLQRLAEEQSNEIVQLRQQAQRAQMEQTTQPHGDGIGPTPPSMASAAVGAAGMGSRRLTDTVAIQLPGSSTPASLSSSPGASGGPVEWVDFNVGPLATTVPTPTLLQPASSSSQQPITSSIGVAQSSTTVDAKLTLGSSSMASGNSSVMDGTPAPDPLRGAARVDSAGSGSAMVAGKSNSSSSKQRSGAAAPPPSSSQLSGGPGPAPSSASLLPARSGSVGSSLTPGVSGTQSPMQPGSPMRRRPGASVRRGASPSKHRRNITAPNGSFFDDLNPLG